jgi:hypothetical protein
MIGLIFREIAAYTHFSVETVEICGSPTAHYSGSVFSNYVVTYYIVSYFRKAVCPNLFAAVPNILI